MCSVMLNDRTMMVNFKPGEYTRKVFLFQSVTAQVEKTFDLWLLVQILYHRRWDSHMEPLIKYMLLQVTSVTIIVSCYR